MSYDAWGASWGNPSAWGAAWVHQQTPPTPTKATPGGDPWRRNTMRAEEDGIILEAIEGFLKGDRWRTRH